MSNKTVLFSSKERVSPEHVSQFLRMLADQLQENRVSFRRDGEDVSLNVPGEMVLEIKAEEKTKKYGIKRSIEIELKWREGEEQRGGVSVE
ncbi:MAG: amphi-Trp domain-containing protein [Chloroflexota bacterium]|nr:amphi-Trp domain-containing protein [Chloroflexota bacterium]